MPLTIKNFSRAWQGHFLSQALQTWQICFFFVDVQMILLSYLDTSDCLEIEKNEKAFHSSCSELLVLSDWLSPTFLWSVISPERLVLHG